MKLFRWIHCHMAETSLFFVFIFSLFPIFKSGAVTSTCCAMGFIWVIASIGYIRYVPDYKQKGTALYSILTIIILILGVSFLYIEKDTVNRTFYLCLSTYFGGMFGFLIGGYIFFSNIKQI